MAPTVPPAVMKANRRFAWSEVNISDIKLQNTETTNKLKTPTHIKKPLATKTWLTSERNNVKNNVKIYQGVTLGALQVKKSLQNTKRHPTVEKNVVIYANATILGGDTTIGANSIIGGNVWITESVPENSFVYHKPETIMKQKK